MANTPEKSSKSDELPAPEVLTVQSDDGSQAPKVASSVLSQRAKGMRRRVTYRPSHKATFIGLAVVIAVLLINGGVIAFVLGGKDPSGGTTNANAVTLSSGVLNSLGVSRNPVGETSEELSIGPNTKFGGTILVNGNTSIGGELTLNKKLSAQDATVTTLQAGNTSLQTLVVNGDLTATNINARTDLSVVGATRLQGAVTIGQLLTVNNSVSVIGNLAVGGTLTARSFQANNLISENTLTIGGHIITAGSAPAVARGSATGSNGSVSISGNDTSGTVAINAGTGAGGGMVAQVAFKTSFPTIPHVVVTPVGGPIGSFYITRSAGGFSIFVTGALSPGGYAFDYIVVQ
ncbi:MAG: hypothetical protein ABIP50_01110 [Candidatus Saccharimonadales bacterium]